MTKGCTELESEEILMAMEYYEKMLSSVAAMYNSFHTPIYLVLCFLGVLANSCFIVVLCRRTMRKNPFNYFLIAIAICDLTLMASYFIFKQVEFCNPIYFSYLWTVVTLAYAITSVLFHSLSLWLTVMMAVLRYLVLRESTTTGSSKLNTYRSAWIGILIAVIISLIGNALNMIRYQIKDGGMAYVPLKCYVNDSEYAHYFTPGQKVHNYQLIQPSFWSCAWDRFSFWTAGVILKIIPCALLTIFMIQMIRLLIEARDRKARLCSTPGSACGSQGPGSSNGGKGQAERTTMMLIFIVAVFLLCELPQGILVIATGSTKTVRYALPHLGNFVDLLSLLNSSINFLLYAFMSQVFRSELVLMFGVCLPQSVRNWHSRRGLKSNGASTRGPNSTQTSTKKLQHRSANPTSRTDARAEHETEGLIDKDQTTESH
ncbi:Blue-sensitive opsin [Aphelenchoides besseyi]|nr:Blue-sensitive opsin [Aphelenchoides besseyi]